MNSSGSAWLAMGRVGLPPVAGTAAPLAGAPGVLILGEDPLARAALASRLAETQALSVVGDESASAAQAAILEHAPDVVLWDLGLQPAAALPALRAGAGEVPVLALIEFAASAPGVLAAGAHGALPRDVEPGRLTAALLALAEGLWVLDDSTAALLLRPTPPLPDDAEALTPREREVVGLLAQGLSNRALGERLGISEHTAKFHVNAILGKLGAASRTEAVMRAVRLGLILV
jgi:DNA-binding NarL/FixJ family response regulator